MSKAIIITAVSRNGVIGVNNKLPWSLPSDLRMFKDITRGHDILMGRKTWQSLGEKPLKDRNNIVITSKAKSIIEGGDSYYTEEINDQTVYFVDDFTNAYSSWRIQNKDTDNVLFIIGGATIYEQALVCGVDEIIMTQLDAVYDPDEDEEVVYFPNIKLDERMWQQEIIANTRSMFGEAEYAHDEVTYLVTRFTKKEQPVIATGAEIVTEFSNLQGKRL